VLLTGIHLALSVDVAVMPASVVLLWLRLRPRGGHRTAGRSVPGERKRPSGQAVDATDRLP
jgi:hypothetical protein